MVHATNRGITQNLNPPDLLKSRWTKNVVDASIVNRGIAGFASQVAKLPQDIAVGFAIVFDIISLEMCLVGSFKFEVEVTGDENFRRLRANFDPFHQRFGISPPPCSIERVSVRTQHQHFRRVRARPE